RSARPPGRRAFSVAARERSRRATRPRRFSRKLPARLEPLFWAHAREELRLPERADVVFLHILAFGSAPQVRCLRRRFRDPAISRWVRQRQGWAIRVERLAPWIDVSEIHAWYETNPSLGEWTERGLVSAADAPECVRRLLKSYEPKALLWAKPSHRYIVVGEILTRGDAGARA